MARPLRVDIKDGVYHVLTRGIDRNAIFRSDQDRKHWLDLMAEAHVRFRLRIFAYVLMDNPVHLIVQTPDANLSRAVQWIKVSYSMWFNAKYRRVEPLFQGRFKSVLVDELDGWLLDLSFYVHLNPVRLRKHGLDKRGKKLEAMGFVKPTADEVKSRMARLRSFRWSSYRYYGEYARGVPEWLDMQAVLSRCPQNDSVKFYRMRARQKVSGGFDVAFMESLANGVALGGAAFLEKVREISGKPMRDVTNKKELRARISWARLIEVAERVRGEEWAVFGFRRGDPAKAVVFLMARRYCGMSLKEIGDAAGGVDYAAVSDRIRRYEKAGKKSAMEVEIEAILNLETRPRTLKDKDSLDYFLKEGKGGKLDFSREALGQWFDYAALTAMYTENLLSEGVKREDAGYNAYDLARALYLEPDGKMAHNQMNFGNWLIERLLKQRIFLYSL